jgi:hypothetical protein
VLHCGTHAIRINEQPIADVVVPMAVGGEAPVEFDGILEPLLVGIEIRAMLRMFLVRGGVWHLA